MESEPKLFKWKHFEAELMGDQMVLSISNQLSRPTNDGGRTWIEGFAYHAYALGS